ncbi:MAG TPA: hypothetical protein VFM43_02440 [Gaiellaceae bacterium]|nr:hypothetical protein [Gaiellaceae bacterium]
MVKPLGIFAGIVVVGLALIVGGLRLTDHSATATPPPAPMPLSQAQFVRTGNAVCADYYRALFKSQTISHPQAKTLKMITRGLRIQVPLMDRLATGLRPLVPPRRDAATYRRLLSVLGQELYDAHAVLHAFETGQFRRGVLIARHGGHLDRAYNSLSRKIGLKVCGLTGRQVKARYG